MTAQASTAEVLAHATANFRVSTSSEARLQDDVETILQLVADGPVRRETHLNRHDRPDFLVSPGIAVECKVAGSVMEVLRQLGRYAEHADVTELLLVTTRNAHLALPAEIYGKPIWVTVVNQGGLAW